MAKQDDTQTQIADKLDTIIGLLASVVPQGDDAPSLAERMRLLNELGLSPSEIGRALAKSNKQVSATLAKAKKLKGAKR